MKFDDEKVEMSEQGVEVCLCVQVVHLLNFVKVMNVHMDKHSIHPVHSDSKLRIPFINSRWPSIKDIGIVLAMFDTPLPHVGILTLIYRTPTF